PLRKASNRSPPALAGLWSRNASCSRRLRLADVKPDTASFADAPRPLQRAGRPIIHPSCCPKRADLVELSSRPPPDLTVVWLPSRRTVAQLLPAEADCHS